jgi:hypothetical protein
LFATLLECGEDDTRYAQLALALALGHQARSRAWQRR